MSEMLRRERTVSWEDPKTGANASRKMSGIEYLRAIMRGDLPAAPIGHLMGFEPVVVEEGRVIFAVEPAEYHYNPIGMVHGGLACTLADSAMGCAVHTMLPAGAGYTTLELKTNFLRVITVDTGRILCEGTIVHAGGRVATAEARVTDEADKLYAHATTTCMVFRPPKDDVAGEPGVENPS